MLIAISSNGSKEESLLDNRFGRCLYFQIYNTENESFRCIENKGASTGGGAGIAAAQQVIDEEVEAVITGNVGPNAFELLAGSDIRIFKGSNNDSVKKLIEDYKNSKLQEINISGPSHSGIK